LLNLLVRAATDGYFRSREWYEVRKEKRNNSKE
jgi:hypothetical protein